MMTRKLVLSLFLLAGLAYAHAGESDVLVLGDSDFDSKIAALDNVLVMFYAPW